MNIQSILSENNISKIEFARKLNITRPTLDRYIELYESGKKIGKDKYDLVFRELFSDHNDTVKFNSQLSRFSQLLYRDNKYGIKDLEIAKSDQIMRLFTKIRCDLSRNDLSIDMIERQESVYYAINTMLYNYMNDERFCWISEYFQVLNSIKQIYDFDKKKISFFVNMYYLLNHYKNLPEVSTDEIEVFQSRINAISRLNEIRQLPKGGKNIER